MADHRPLDTNAVLNALKVVQDPDLFKDIVTLGFVKDVTIKGGAVAFTVELTTPACPVKEQLKAQAEAAVRALAGVQSVTVTMTAAVRASVNAGPNALPAVRNIIAVGSGKGGVGKSTVAANIACGLALDGARVGCLDADMYGPSIPMMFGAEGKPGFVPGKEGKQLISPMTAHGVKLMSMGFLVEPDKAVIWRGPMLHGALRQFFGDVAWGELDYLIIDLPPGTGDVALTMVQTVPLAGAVIVSTPQAVAMLDAKKALAMFNQTGVPILGIVENMSGSIFGDGGAETWAKTAGVRFLGKLPLAAGVRVSGDAGRPAVLDADPAISGPYRALARQLAAAVSIRNAESPAQAPISLQV